MTLPARIGRYAVLGELGQGAMGVVYRGRDEALDRDVALKVMSRGQADADARARFLREARAAAKLQHPNIVVVYELGEHEGAPFMVLELLEGVDLQRAIEAGVRPDPRATLPVVLQLLAGLGHAHDHGIVHRDVKPSNVFLPRGLPAKIMDFGVARLAGVGTTTAGVVVGTPNYMSPEQAVGGEIDGRSDLFSAGLILYELVTGEKAYQADSLVAVLYKISHEPPDLSLIPEGPGWERVRGVLERALAHRPADRHPDARAMARDLARALAELGGAVDWGVAPSDQALLARPKPAVTAVASVEIARPAVSASPAASAPPAVARPATRGWTAVAGGGAAVLALLGTGAWLWLRSSPVVAPAAAPVPSTLPSPSAAPPSVAPPEVAVSSTAPPPTPEPTPTPAAELPAAPPAPPPETPAPEATPAPAPGAALSPEARLLRAEDHLARGRWAEALAEARAVLEAQPTNPRAAAVAQQAEAEVVVEECLRNARAALAEGDRERALAEVRRGSIVRKNDPRLLALHAEIIRQ